MKRTSLLRVGWVALALACSDGATAAVVQNAYPAGGPAVLEAWWYTTLFRTPVGAGGTSEALRTVPASDYAYAVLAPGWDPASGTAPTTLLPVRSASRLVVDRGGALSIVVGPQTFVGDCAAGAPLSQQDADFITERIFPGTFAGATYDAATCTLTWAGDADAGPDD